MKDLHELLLDPAKINVLSKEELVLFHNQIKGLQEELEAADDELRKILLEKIDLNGEVIGTDQVLRGEKIVVTTTLEDAEQFAAVKEEVDPEKISLDHAREIGAIKRTVDANQIRKMVRKGAVVPGIEKVAYLIIKPLNRSKDVEQGA